MKQLLLLALVSCLAFTSCEKSAEDQLDIDIAKIEDYLNKNNINAERDDSGVYYVIDEPGEGDETPTINSTVVQYYDMILLEDEDVVQSVRTQPEERLMGSLLQGWQIGLRNFKKGAKGRIFIPSLYAYGQFGIRGAIPGDAVIILDVDLVNFF